MFYGDFFKIKNIEISGQINESIKQEINTYKGKNILLFTIGQKDKELATHQTSIEELNIIKGIPDTLKIDVLVRRPLIRWKTKDKDYYIDQNGIIFELANPTDDDKTRPEIIDSKNLDVTLGSKVVSSDFIYFITKLFQDLPLQSKKEIEEVRINDTTLDVEVKFKNSYKIFLSTIDNIDDQLYLISKVIEKHDSEIGEYIDLRVKNRAYYK